MSRSEWKETEHDGGIVVCGDCFKPLWNPGYHLWGVRDADGKREKVCVDEPIGAYLYQGRRLALALVAVMLMIAPLSAQTVTPCAAPQQTCKLTPPSTFQYAKAQPPFNAPVMFGGIVTVSGAPYWMWRKAGEPPTPCTAKTHANSPGGNEPGCAAKIGDVLYITQQFTVKAAREATLSVAIEPPRVQLSIAPECSSKDERFTVPRYACLRIPAALLVNARTIEVVRYPEYRSTGAWPDRYVTDSGGGITIPYRVDGAPLGTRSVALYAINAEGRYSQILPETRLLDLPVWTGGN